MHYILEKGRNYRTDSSQNPGIAKRGQGGGGQANLSNARILRAFGTVTPPYLQ